MSKTIYITSEENKIFKKILSLQNKKYRDKYGQYFIEGEKTAKEAINTSNVEAIVLSDRKDDIFDIDKNINKIILEDRLFKKISETVTSQGVMAILKKPNISEDDFLNIVKFDEKILLLDKLQDPGNVGTIIRTSIAGGYKGIICIKGTVDVYSPKVVRSTSSGIWKIPIIYVEDEEQAIKLVKKMEKEIIVTSLLANKYYDEIDIEDDKGICLVVGNEGNGVSQKIIDKSDYNVKIPMNVDIESLNVAVATGILIYRWKGKIEDAK